MATLTLTSSGWDAGQIRITYTASNGTLKITEIEGKRGDGYRSYNENDTAISISVGGTSKSISLSHYVDFGASGWVTWGATDTSWTGLSGTSIKVSTTMQSGTPAYSGHTFTGNATMSWSTYTITYNANGGTFSTKTQTKTHGTDITIPSAKPTRDGYTFKGWCVPDRTDVDSKYHTEPYYQPSGTIAYNGNQTLKAVWTENKLTVNFYSNYANYGTYQGETLNVSAGTNVLVYSKEYLYDNSYSDGLSNVQNADYLYLSRTGYTPTGFWGTSTSGGTLINQTTSFDSGQELAEAVGKTLKTGNASINLYVQWSENKLTIHYYSNYATSAFAGALNAVGADKNVEVYKSEIYYDNDYSTYGLANYSGSSGSVYMTRTGYTATGNWGTSTSGGTLVNENTKFATGQKIAEALGKSLKTGNATINLYAQWTSKSYIIAYNSNGGLGNMPNIEIDWQENFIISNNLFKKDGYKFVGWNLYRNNDNKWYATGKGWFTENDIVTNGYSKKLYANQTSLTFNNSWINGNETATNFTFFAVWEISGVIYIHNGTEFKPYVPYIHNGTDWDLYLAYIHNGTDWDIIS